MEDNEPLSARFAGKVRIRVCGVCIRQNRILLVKHRGLGPAGYLWNPPGGGIDFGESVEQALKREFLEETGLQIEVGNFLHFNEFIGQGLHALELFFEVSMVGGELRLGTDPELDSGSQMMEELKFWSKIEIANEPVELFHVGLSKYFPGT